MRETRGQFITKRIRKNPEEEESKRYDAWPEESGGHMPDPCLRYTFLRCDDDLSPDELPTGQTYR